MFSLRVGKEHILKYLLYLFALPAFAQFSGLTTTPDGSRLYFASTLRQRNTAQPLHGKVFTLDDREIKPSLILDHQLSSYANITAPYLDSTGNLAGHSASNICRNNFLTPCTSVEASTWRNLRFQGTLTLSPNRRYALNSASGRHSEYTFTLLNLETNQRLATATKSPASHLVTNEGVVWRNRGEGIERLTTGATTFETVISIEQARFTTGIAHIPNTSRILTWSNQDSISQLLQFDMVTKLRTSIGPPLPLACTSIAAATNQTWIATCQSGIHTQLLRLDSPQSNWRIIAPKFREFTLSASGRILWYLTSDNAFHKVDLIEETDETRLPPIGSIESTQSIASPGSLYFIQGEGIESATLQMSTLGVPRRQLTPISKSPTQLIYLIPPDILPPYFFHTLEIQNLLSPFFEFRQPLSTVIQPVGPLFFDISQGASNPRPTQFAARPLAVHQDFSSLVTRENPVGPGGIVHLYALNLGPVPATFFIIPLPRLSVETATIPDFTCIGNNPNDPPVLLYAGPAPGIIGLHQITLRMPQGPPSNSNVGLVYNVACGFASAFNTSGLIPALEGANP